ncbi:helix-turn-helix domain-containing protein [Halorientalis persicus]|uniref:helix-turn-helix domain-containing protein n=1 Tax=Halorientalis persicus TaxID=1367881 RepID=UPI001113E169|nr:helix-turn-helix domain-containing protein [Halorientalis persicus]
MTHDKHDESGKFTPTYEPEEFLSAVAEIDLPTTADVADHVGCAHRTALYHLNKLEDAGDLNSQMAGRAKIWMLSSSTE